MPRLALILGDKRNLTFPWCFLVPSRSQNHSGAGYLGGTFIRDDGCASITRSFSQALTRDSCITSFNKVIFDYDGSYFWGRGRGWRYYNLICWGRGWLRNLFGGRGCLTGIHYFFSNSIFIIIFIDSGFCSWSLGIWNCSSCLLASCLSSLLLPLSVPVSTTFLVTFVCSCIYNLPCPCYKLHRNALNYNRYFG